MNILVIGFGYAGSKIGSAFKSLGNKIYTTATTEEKYHLRADNPEFSGVYHLEEIPEAVRKMDIVIVCCSANSGADYENTYGKTCRMITQGNPHLQQLVYLSSTGVYGDFKGAVVDEATTPHPDKRGGILLGAEEELLKLQPKFPVVIFRLGQIVGEGREVQKRLKRSITLPDTASHYCNLIHIEDVVLATLYAVHHSLCGIYNLVCDFHPSRYKLYEMASRKHRLPMPIWDRSKSPVHGGNKLVCNEKIKKSGFVFMYGNEDVIV